MHDVRDLTSTLELGTPELTTAEQRLLEARAGYHDLSRALDDARRELVTAEAAFRRLVPPGRTGRRAGVVAPASAKGPSEEAAG